jgi:hypothetical protein
LRVNYFEFVVSPESPYLQNGVVEVSLNLPQDKVFARTCTPGDVFKISDADLPQCNGALNSFQDEEVEEPYKFFQAREHSSDPPGVLDFMSFVSTP